MPDDELSPAELRQIQDEMDSEDDPVIEERRACGDCQNPGVPLDDNRRCDECASRYITLMRRELEWENTSMEPAVFQFVVEITVPAKSRNSLDLQEARLRANEILLGMPMVGDRETWSHELIATVDEDGNEIPYEPEKD